MIVLVLNLNLSQVEIDIVESAGRAGEGHTYRGYQRELDFPCSDGRSGR